MNKQAKCSKCGATEPDINVFQPTPDEARAGGSTTIDCKKCGHHEEY